MESKEIINKLSTSIGILIEHSAYLSNINNALTDHHSSDHGPIYGEIETLYNIINNL